jgi:aerobic-type carbon monoxide dehydrogenase small subunit (CoxS/CutS family)
MTFTLTINGKSHHVDVEPGTWLLWVLRDSIGPIGARLTRQ